MNLSKLFRTTLVALTALSLAKPANSLAADKPNILIILVDDLGYGDLSCYGANDLQSPNIDSLMADGMRFDSFYANCPVCSPTRAALLRDRKSTRLNSSHDQNSYAVFCLKKKKN